MKIRGELVTSEELLRCMVNENEGLSLSATRYASLITERDERLATNLIVEIAKDTSRAGDSAPISSE